MRVVLAGLGLLLSCVVVQCGVSETPVPAQAQLRGSLLGDWVGVLEYRDYSEPVGSTKRVDLPTWLSVTAAADGQQTWRYVYDDGPAKTVTETDVVTFDTAKESYESAENGKRAQTFAVKGYAGLKEGRGVLVLTGNGTDAGKPADLRETMTIRRNLLEVLEETRAAGSGDGFAFRHVYRFVRRDAPVVTGTR